MASDEQLTHTDQSDTVEMETDEQLTGYSPTFTAKSDMILKIGENLYLNEEAADFHFIFEISDGQYERVPAHKILLKAASNFFRTMFNGSWSEYDEIEITDAKVDEFKGFLQFFYLGQVKISMDKVARLMYLGNKYNITRCLNVCIKFIIQVLKEDNACWAYELAIDYDIENLKKYCETFIGMNTKAVLASKNFLVCSLTTLSHILKIKSLSCQENELFEACMNWVKATAGVNLLTREVVQAQLGEAFYDIRIKSMTPQGFAQLIPSYGRIFSIDEHIDISQAVALPEFQSNIFSNKIRTTFDDFKYDINHWPLVCNRLMSRHFSEKPYFIKSIEKTRFSTNTPLFLKKIECSKIRKFENNLYQSIEELPTELTIVEISNSKKSPVEIVLYNGNYTLQSETCTVVTLPKPILIRPDFMYEIRLKQSPPEGCCTGVILKTKVELKSIYIGKYTGNTVKFHEDPILNGDFVATGTIAILIFDRVFNRINSANRTRPLMIID